MDSIRSPFASFARCRVRSLTRSIFSFFFFFFFCILSVVIVVCLGFRAHRLCVTAFTLQHNNILRVSECVRVRTAHVCVCVWERVCRYYIFCIYSDVAYNNSSWVLFGSYVSFCYVVYIIKRCWLRVRRLYYSANKHYIYITKKKKKTNLWMNRMAGSCRRWCILSHFTGSTVCVCVYAIGVFFSLLRARVSRSCDRVWNSIGWKSERKR